MAGRHLPCQHQYSRQIARACTARSACVGNLAGRLASHEGASTSGRHHLSEPRLQPSRRLFSEQFQCRVVAPGREQEAAQTHQSSLDQQSLASQPTKAPVCDPETFTVEAGELSGVNQEASQHPDDVFRCSGCSLEECQVNYINFSCNTASTSHATPLQAGLVTLNTRLVLCRVPPGAHRCCGETLWTAICDKF